ncbi:hypothetical protein B296_00023115 [Ensete ventricosum]|uniref:OTU domain-containing protein n=1 Tax=Ensete ventricosum TaxID=4639 RepID=A0A426ZSL1_ENSVE|nr:hypothetical protein B296_00023115 [Ensete ventricosum]
MALYWTLPLLVLEVSFDRAVDCQFDPLRERHCVKVACVCRGGHRHGPRVLGCQPTDRHRRSADVRESDGRRQPANTAGSHIPTSSPAVYDTARISKLVLSLLSENARPNRKHEIVANKHLKRGDEFVVRVKRRSTLCPISAADPATVAFAWAAVSGLDEQQRRRLEKIHARGVFWKNPGDAEDPGVAFRLEHGGDVEADGNCLFTAARRAMGPKTAGARELRQRAVQRFLEDYGSADGAAREAVDVAIRHLYSPDLKAGWGIHVVQEVKLLAKKADREGLDAAIQELVDLGLQRYNIIAFSFLFN